MSIDLKQLKKNIEEADLPFVVNVKEKTIGDDKDPWPILELDLWSLKGFLKEDSEAIIPLIVGDTDNDGKTLSFIVPGLVKMAADELAVFMDANRRTKCKGFKWDPEDDVVSYSYCLPLNKGDVPTQEAMSFILTEICEGLSFPQYRDMMIGIQKNPVCSDDEKKAQMEKLSQAMSRLKGELDEMAI